MADIFRENQPTAALPIALLVGMGLFEAYVAQESRGLPRYLHITQWCLVGLFLLTSVLFRQFWVRVTDKHLLFGFGPFRKRVPRKDIVSVRIVEAALQKTGIGIHRTAGGLRTWIARPGPAIEILLINSTVPGYVISTGRPRDLKAVLLESSDLTGASKHSLKN